DGCPPRCTDAAQRRCQPGGGDPAAGPGARGPDASLLRHAGNHLPGAGRKRSANKKLDL
ncbi:MAG: hypothetical protein AVDCRST_MAG68-4773, partial [uncultured Gemmatimonadetes bacterium]